MSKKLYASLLLVAVILILTPTVFAGSEIKVTIDNKPQYFDVDPQNIDGRVLVPMRTIFESLGTELGWDGSTQTVTGIKGNIKIILKINNKIAIVNDKQVELDVPAKIIDGRTLVPARFIAESLGGTVDWHRATNTVVIKSSDNNISDPDYYYFLYNSTRITKDDLAAIKSYVNKFTKTYNILKDVSEYGSSIDIYNALKSDSVNRKGQLLGIQIFGTSQDVPSFEYLDQVILYNPVNKNTSIRGSNEVWKTDYFYSTFKTNSNVFTKDLSIYKIFDEKLDISLIPEWKVSRLPLTNGEFSGFIQRYYDYEIQRNSQGNIPLVCFSSPTFRQSPSFYKQQGDDISFFIERLDKDFKIIPSDSYRLYGNQRGLYKVNSTVVGDLTRENIHSENEKGIRDFIFNGHGGPNILQHTYREVDIKDGKEKEYSDPFLTNQTINTALNKNYYTLSLWACESAHDLDNANIVHEAMANGKCMNAIAGSSNLSGNGMYHYHEHYDELADLNRLKENSPYYFIYVLYDNIQKGKSRSESFFAAKKAYTEEILNHTNLGTYGNYQCNFMNVLGLHYLGLIEYDN